MPLTSVSQHNCSRGEAPEDLDYRQDNDLYLSSVRRGTNMIVAPTGPIEKRTGFEVMGLYDPHKSDPTLQSSVPLRILPFTFSDHEEYVLVFYAFERTSNMDGEYTFDPDTVPAALLCDFYNINGEHVNTHNIQRPHHSRFYIECTYTQVYDTLILCHPQYQTVTVQRNVDDTQWFIRRLEFLNPPFYRFNTSARLTTTSEPDEDNNPLDQILRGSRITVNSSEDIFDNTENRPAGESTGGKKFKLNIGPADNPGIVVEQVGYSTRRRITAEVLSEIPTVSFTERDMFVLNNATPDVLWEVNPTTGESKSLRELPTALANPQSMVFHNGRILVCDINSDNLWEIDPDAQDSDEGVLLRDLPSGVTNVQGMVSIDSRLFLLDDPGGAETIWEIDDNGASGEGEQIATFASTFTGTATAIAAHPRHGLTNVYVIESNTRRLWTIDLTDDSDEGSIVGTLPSGLNAARGLAWINDQLYAVQSGSPDSVWRIDTATPANSTKTADLPTTLNSPVAATYQPAFQVIDPRVEDDYKHLDDSLQWSEQAWSFDRGWPRTMVFHQGRLVAGGSRELPQTVFGSRLGEPFDFYNGAADDEGYIKDISSDKREFILQLVSKSDLHIFCSSSTFVLSAGLNVPITPSTGAINKQNTVGTNRLKPVEYRENLLFIANDNRSMYFTQYDRELLQYKNENISVISPRNIENPTSISILDNWLNKYSIVITTNLDGTISCLSLDSAQSVWGWSSWNTYEGENSDRFKGFIEGVTVGDRYYCLVGRNNKIYLERLTDEEVYVDHWSKLEVGTGETAPTNKWKLPTIGARSLLLTDTTSPKVIMGRQQGETGITNYVGDFNYIDTETNYDFELTRNSMDVNLVETVAGIDAVSSKMQTLPLPFTIRNRLILGQIHTVKHYILYTKSLGEVTSYLIAADTQGLIGEGTVIISGEFEFRPGITSIKPPEDILIPRKIVQQSRGTSVSLVVASESPHSFELLGWKAMANVRFSE